MEKIDEEDLPKKLYKYRSWPDPYTEDILINNRLYMSSANDFNDPFEGSIPLDYSGSVDELLLRYIKGYKEIEGHDFPPAQIEKIKAAISMRTEAELKSFGTMELEELKKRFGICSLSSNKNSILMWSHYAQNHTGICIGIEGLENNVVKKVFYETKYPAAKYIKHTPREIIDKQFFTKSYEWEYEHEYRIVAQNLVGKTFPIVPSMIKYVICGCKMSLPAMDHLINLLKKREYPVTLYQAKKKKNDFGLDIENNIIGVYGGLYRKRS